MDVYEQLREVLDTHPTTAPKSKAIIEILKTLFTPEEAAVAVSMSFKPGSIEKIAAACSLSPVEAEARLESMANKGIIFSKKKDGNNRYGLVPLVPGVFEFPFMKGGDSVAMKRLGRLWEDYHREAFGASFSGNPTPLMRVVAVGKALRPEDRVHPYEEVESFINNASYIALANCACRVSVGKCDRPKDVCLIFDGAGEFLAERGFARHITKEEGLQALDRAEQAGLVHTSNNSAERPLLICNCCPCCCTVLRGKTQLHHPHAFEPSRFEAQVIADQCTGCGICADERCPVKAIEIKDELAIVNTAECIGCGLCVSGCEPAALKLVQRASVPAVPATTTEMGIKIAMEKGRLDAFAKIMQR